MSKLDMAGKTSKMGGFTVMEICIVVVLLVFLAAVIIVTRSHDHGGPGPSDLCISNLRIIDGAKGAWAVEFDKQNTDTPPDSDIQPYMGHGPNGSLPFCPADPKHTFGTSYSVNNMASKPTCKINPTKHILP